VELQTAHQQAHAVRAEPEVLGKAIATLAQGLRMDSLLDSLLRCILDVIPYDSAAVRPLSCGEWRETMISSDG